MILLRYAVLFFSLLPGVSAALDLSGYQRPDGAITVHRYGDNVDPYFAMKALWAARQLGDPTTRETQAWINWLLPRQNKDGGFARYCEREKRWEICDSADADDSMLALWIVLLYEAEPRRMSARLATSVHQAELALERLMDKNTGVYRVSPRISDALLMDNAEIYEALRRVGELLLSAGDSVGAQRYFARAQSLRLAMGRVFGPSGTDLLRWTSGDPSGDKFYPHRLAHIFPWLHGMDTGVFGPMLNGQGWLSRYGEGWLTRTDDSYPWGLVAMAAYRAKAYKEIERWLDNAPALRDGEHWNILEEAVLQGLARKRLEGKWK